MRGAIPPLCLYVFMAWCLVKHRDNFTFTLYWVCWGSKVRFPTGAGNFFIFSSRTALGLTQPLIQWVTGALSLGVNRPGREADNSPFHLVPRSRMRGAIPLLPNTPSWRGAQLKKAHGQLSFPFLSQCHVSLVLSFGTKIIHTWFICISFGIDATFAQIVQIQMTWIHVGLLTCLPLRILSLWFTEVILCVYVIGYLVLLEK
jgi:hypothetical protein